jgi:hypothetical protein
MPLLTRVNEGLSQTLSNQPPLTLQPGHQKSSAEGILSCTPPAIRGTVKRQYCFERELFRNKIIRTPTYLYRIDRLLLKLVRAGIRMPNAGKTLLKQLC